MKIIAQLRFFLSYIGLMLLLARASATPGVLYIGDGDTIYKFTEGGSRSSFASGFVRGWA